MLVVLEGLDGSGKTTVANALAKKMLKNNHDVIVNCFEKYEASECVQKLGRIFSHESRFLLQLACFLNANKEIDKHLSSGKIVIADRYIYSIISYYQATDSNSLGGLISEIEYVSPSLKILLCCNSRDRKLRLANRSSTLSERKLSTLGEYGKLIFKEYEKLGPWVAIRTDKLENMEVVDLIISEIENEKKFSSCF